MTTFPIVKLTILADFGKLRDTSWTRSSQWLIIKISPDERRQSLLQLYIRSNFEGTRPPGGILSARFVLVLIFEIQLVRSGTNVSLERRSRAFIWYNFYEMAFRGRCFPVKSASRSTLLVQPKPLIEPSRRSCHLFDLPAAKRITTFNLRLVFARVRPLVSRPLTLHTASGFSLRF